MNYLRGVRQSQTRPSGRVSLLDIYTWLPFQLLSHEVARIHTNEYKRKLKGSQWKVASFVAFYQEVVAKSCFGRINWSLWRCSFSGRLIGEGPTWIDRRWSQAIWRQIGHHQTHPNTASSRFMIVACRRRPASQKHSWRMREALFPFKDVDQTKNPRGMNVIAISIEVYNSIRIYIYMYVYIKLYVYIVYKYCIYIFLCICKKHIQILKPTFWLDWALFYQPPIIYPKNSKQK